MNLKNIRFPVAFACLLSGCTESGTAEVKPGKIMESAPEKDKTMDLSGEWTSDAGNDSETYSITLEHDPKTGKIRGRHCFVVDDGSQLDCPMEDYSFRGKLDKNRGEIMLHSDWADDSLKLNVTIEGNSVFLLDIAEETGMTFFSSNMKFRKSK